MLLLEFNHTHSRMQHTFKADYSKFELSFSSPRPVAIPRLKSTVCPIIYSLKTRLHTFPQEHYLEVKRKQSCLGFEACPWCNGYRHRKWTQRQEFKSWTRLIAFHIALIHLGKVWIQLFPLQLWVNNREDWVLQPWWGNKSNRRKTLNSDLLKLRLKIELVSHPSRAEGLVNRVGEVGEQIITYEFDSPYFLTFVSPKQSVAN